MHYRLPVIRHALARRRYDVLFAKLRDSTLYTAPTTKLTTAA